MDIVLVGSALPLCVYFRIKGNAVAAVMGKNQLMNVSEVCLSEMFSQSLSWEMDELLKRACVESSWKRLSF